VPQLLVCAEFRVEARLGPGCVGWQGRKRHRRRFCVLALLARGPLSQRQLIDVLGVDKSTVVRVVDDLERQGLLTRRRDPHDRRAHAVELTDHGRQRLDAAQAAARDLGAHLFGWLTDRDRRRLHATLQRIIQAAQSH
jgi:DNA-binding MarR family transcriptional regulator